MKGQISIVYLIFFLAIVVSSLFFLKKANSIQIQLEDNFSKQEFDLNIYYRELNGCLDTSSFFSMCKNFKSHYGG
jgi:hypothetical protein